MSKEEATRRAFGAMALSTALVAGCGTTQTAEVRHTDHGAGGGTGMGGSVAGGSGGGFVPPNSCPVSMPVSGDPCSGGLSDDCEYTSECDGGGACRAQCIGGAWFVSCPSCGTPFVCPPSVPTHGAACQDGVKQTCVFDTCDDGGATFLAATCEHGVWVVDSRICAKLGCVGGEDDFGCPTGNACIEGAPCSKRPGRECQQNPCLTEPFSCACAAILCPDDTICDSAIDGRIKCKEPPRSPSDPFVVADGLSLQGPLAIRMGTLYAAARGSRALVAIDAAAGVTQDLGDVGASAHDVVADADGIYWAEQIRVVMGAPDGAQTVLVDSTTAQRIAVDAAYVYFDTGGSDAQKPNTVQRVSKAGGAPEGLAKFVMPTGIAVDTTSIYVADRNNATNLGIIYRLPLSGGSPVALATEQGFPSSIALEPSSVYWLDEWPPDVKAYTKSGGPPVPLYSAEAGKSTPKGIAVDVGNVYFTDSDTGNVMKAPAGAGPAILWAKGPLGASGIAVDDRYVYWTTSCGRVLRVEK